MALKDILVHLDDSPQCEMRVEVAAGLAAAHDAHLVGLYVYTPPYVPQFVRTEVGGQLEEMLTRQAAESRDRVQAMFETRLRHATVRHEWRASQGDAYDILALHARYADLTIVGQRNPDGGDERPIADHLVLDAGRPVLVVPHTGRSSGSFETVMVAWNGSREATRAVNDALPLLERARKVVIVAGSAGHGQVPGADIGLHLARHGINVEAQHLQVEDNNAGAMLLSRAADIGADLLVMGAYGRSRVRELVLGGASAHILGHMTLPVLLSH